MKGATGATGFDRRDNDELVTSPTPTYVAGASHASPAELDSPALLNAFRIMYTSRCLDDREILLKRQSKIFFRSAAPATKQSKPPPGWSCARVLIGRSRTIGIVRSR